MTTLTAARRRLSDIVEQAQHLDAMIEDAERCESAGDPALPALETARLLVRIDRIASRLEALGDHLAALGPFESADDSVRTLEA